MEQDIRWKQRFENFTKAYKHLKQAVEQMKNPSDLEKEGTIQRFEFTHELAWKVMKDFLQDKGIQGIIGSKDATRHAFQNELISNGQAWMDMIESRNKTVHTYIDDILETEYRRIREVYFPLLSEFYEKMKTYL
ncbi:MAG: nucleotidyltransferase substrate binding protein [Lacibacter sp.]|jgi:nucleotidyltransferase substrate binding protein (TIGR01987 family)